MFLVNVQEAFGIHPNEALEMSFALIQAMLQEYYFMRMILTKMENLNG